MPDPTGGGNPEAAKQFLTVMNRVAVASEHLARSIDGLTAFLAQIRADGRDPVEFARNAVDMMGRLFGGKGRRK